LADRLRALAEERSIPVEALAGSQAFAGDVRAVLGRREVKAETVERVARHVLKTDPQDIYGDAHAEAAKHAGRRVDARDACFDLCFSDVKSGSLFYAGADEATRREYVVARQEAIKGALGWLEAQAGVVVAAGCRGQPAPAAGAWPCPPRWRLGAGLRPAATLEREVTAWEATRNSTGRGVDWHFTIEDARIKLKHLYPGLIGG
jgi:hypothetical protein